MALTSKANGSTGMTLDTDVTLTTITDAGVYLLKIDSNPLTAEDEILILIVKTKVRTGGTIRIEERCVLARGLDTLLIKEDKPRASMYSVEYMLRQEGGTARTIEWEVYQLE